jgi:peroxiredoxin
MAAKETPVCDFGALAPGFSLPDTRPGTGEQGAGRIRTLEDCRGEKGTLVMFICNHCPYVKAVLDRLLRDTRELAGLGVNSVAIMSNDAAAYPEDSPANMARLAADKDFPFPYLYDQSQEVARAYGAVCTPDFFGYNANLELQYRGRLDPGVMQAPPDNAPRELFQAMSLIASTGRGPEKQVPSVGCSIKWR